MYKLILFFALLFKTSAYAQNNIQYTSEDSTKIVRMIENGHKLNQDSNIILYYARLLKDIPYGAKTLDKNTNEKLVVNLTRLDCTTYVENVCALSLCVKNKKKRFEDFCYYLRLLRYHDGEISYINRLHYFTQWIENNTNKGFVNEVTSPDPPFIKKQTLDINYMSTHSALYPTLKREPLLIECIKEKEKLLCGKICRYIPKDILNKQTLLNNVIKNGDIIAIVTNREGLDTSHIGIAVWHKDGIHLLNASTIHKKVVEEPLTLYNYMKKHPSQKGVRVIRMSL